MKMKTEASKKNQKQKKKPMENMLVWRCKGDDRKKNTSGTNQWAEALIFHTGWATH